MLIREAGLPGAAILLYHSWVNDIAVLALTFSIMAVACPESWDATFKAIRNCRLRHEKDFRRYHEEYKKKRMWTEYEISLGRGVVKTIGFLESMAGITKYFDISATAPERQLGLAKSYLSPELKDWFDLVKLEDSIRFCDWLALKDTLLRQYRDKHVCRAAKKKIAILKCTETVSDYNNKVDVEALKLKKAGTSEWDLLDSYIEGLPPAVMFQTDRQEPQTLQEAMEKALDNEAWLQQASARGGKWAKGAGPILGGSPPIHPTGPTPMELCGVRRSIPLYDPKLPQALWEER
uniref:Retrotransposon gag domain-containing protein n=1 Tax=Chromera velia CCMP2878 TaxID=1169474 RepID=A0A0G4H3T1_9ALVE|eukprot:Cvel_24563.t1-p1 / transcript=Cvel_24563.t1 / gene=Cvel_24563 / organism=Chromera_velia_CCMP2878 / gene_product=hypothetical protein / transcript_product=hypothetical protein / location=Cvel_scaffold2672:3931-9044(+) / protein_length=291 / sequence_SO=supercontig / SO=protein_coding / is_pseudo=false